MADEKAHSANQAENSTAENSSTRISSFSERIRRYAVGLSNLQSVARLVVIVVAAIMLAFILLWFLDKVVYYYFARTYVEEVAHAFDLNAHLANALILLTFFAAVFFGRLIWSLSKARRRIGIAGFAMLFVGHSFLLWIATRDILVDRTGNALKCYVLSRDGKVTYGELPGIDPATGRECRSVKPEIVERLQEYAAGKRAQKINDPNPTFFDPRSGEPIVWYYQSKDGNIALYDLMGFEPNTGEELSPVTKQIVQEWKTQSRRGPKLIKDPENYIFFDPVTGNSRAWYWRDDNGGYQFYDAPGFQPQTGDQIKLVTRDVVDDWKKHINVAHAPQRVDPTKYPFFDPITGTGQVWYWRGKDGKYEFYDTSGFQPETGDKLSLVTPDLVSEWKASLKASQVLPSATTTQKDNVEGGLRRNAAIFLVNLYAGVSGHNNEVIEAAGRNYAERVKYYGKPYSREQVLAETEAFDERWPSRSYTIQPSTLVINCDEVAMTCEVNGVLNFDCKSPERSQRSSGVATFAYVLKYYSSNGQPVIVEESGDVKVRHVEPFAISSTAPAGSQPVVPGQLPPDQEMILRAILGGMLGQMGR
jgi:hypothetical protein